MMKNFTFNTTASISVRNGGAHHLAEYLEKYSARKILFITDTGILNSGLIDQILKNLQAAGIHIKLFTDVLPDPPEAVIAAATKIAIDYQANCVIGFGGGSSMDVAKLVALLAKNGSTLDAVYGLNNAKGSRLPLILVPTTSGTGSEVTPISIVTTGANEKKGVISPLLLPDLALLDAELTLGLPRHITAATGIDAMVHAIEAYTGKMQKNLISDCFAKEALALLSRSIHRACQNGSDLQARQDMLLGACLAGMSFANSPVGAVHALAYPVGARHHVPHGLSNSLVLPYIAKFNLETIRPEYAELFDIVAPTKLNSIPEKSSGFIDYLAKLAPSLGLPTRLSEVGISRQDLPALAADAMQQTRLLVNNPRELTLHDAFSIYEEAL